MGSGKRDGRGTPGAGFGEPEDIEVERGRPRTSEGFESFAGFEAVKLSLEFEVIVSSDIFALIVAKGCIRSKRSWISFTKLNSSER